MARPFQGSLYPKGLQGNATPIDSSEPITPLYTTYPLTNYRYRWENGRQIFNIDDRDVEQLRDYCIENKK